MLQALCRNEGALLLLPASAAWDITRLDAAERALSLQTGRSPTLEEVAKQVKHSAGPPCICTKLSACIHTSALATDLRRCS